jgi:hypothetical protein
MEKRIKIITIGLAGLFMISAIGSVSATFNGGEPGGLTPGFWKNLQKHGIYWEEYNPDDMIGDIFELPPGFESLNVELIDALKFGGGKGLLGMAMTLLRQAVAAILNDANEAIEYQYSGDIIPDVNDALASLNRDIMEDLKDNLDEANNYGFEFP